MLRGEETMSQAGEVEQVTKKIEETRDEMIKKVKEAFDNANKSKFSYLELGKALLKARQICRANFYLDIPESVVPKKQVQRYMRLVACSSCYDLLSKQPSGKDYDGLKVDENIAGIKEDDLLTLKDPSMKKIALMKELDTPEDFKAVLGGDDTKYDELTDKKEAEAKAEKEAKALAQEEEFLNTGMTKKEVTEFKAAGIDEALKEVLKYKAEQKKLIKDMKDKDQTITNLLIEIEAKDETLDEQSKPIELKLAANQ